MSRNRNYYPPQFRHIAVLLLIAYGNNVRRVSKMTGIPQRTLRHWRQQYHEKLEVHIKSRQYRQIRVRVLPRTSKPKEFKGLEQ
jgi:transposase-like protein